MDITTIFKNNERWVQEKLKGDKKYFKTVFKEQHPDYLYIGCSDSRVTAEEIMGFSPGEAFIHRNIANMVISIDLNSTSVIEYAINYLEVKHIILCGHYGCGGVAAAMENRDLGILNPWLRNIRDVYRLHKSQLLKIKNQSERFDKLVELNVQEQCVNIVKFIPVQKAIKDRGLEIHGWVFDMKSGKLKDLKINFHKLLKNIRDIYHMDL